MYTSNNHPLPLQKFKNLADNHDLHSVSIYLSMDKKGKEQNQGLAQTNLKHCIKEVHNALKDHIISEKEITSYLQPIESLLANVELWRNPSNGLALFLDRKGFTYYTLPISFETRTEVGSNFYLQPLLPLYSDDGIYYLLELSQDYIKLYEASKFGLKDLEIKNLVPDQIEKAVGFDYHSKMIQVRNNQGSHGEGAFHGYGEGKDDHKKEILAFFRAIDKGVTQQIKNSKAPLIVACINAEFPIYKKANSYSLLIEKNISGDPEFKDKNELHKASWKLIQPYFEKRKNEKLIQFNELYASSKVAFDITDIIPAAFNGNIDTLFIQKNSDVYGTYDKDKNRVHIDDKKKMNNASLTNLSSLNTFIKGGKVYLIEPEEMPAKGRLMNALLRY